MLVEEDGSVDPRTSLFLCSYSLIVLWVVLQVASGLCREYVRRDGGIYRDGAASLLFLCSYSLIVLWVVLQVTQ